MNAISSHHGVALIRKINIAALAMLVLAVSCTKLEGTITSEGEALGNWSLVPDECMTGDRERTVGATLYSSKEPSLSVKIAKDMSNRIMVAVAIPSTCDSSGLCKAVILDSSKCSSYSADVKLTNIMTPDDYRQADGRLELDCMVYIGLKKSRVRGTVSFSNCN